MELTLYRVYYPEATNGELYHGGALLCYTIELPWKNNERQRSCIPEGRYLLRRRYSRKFGAHLLVAEVPGRSCILVHPANDAARELRGCLAPVTTLVAPGKGLASRTALARLLRLLSGEEKSKPVYLTIKTKQHEPYQQDTGTHA